MTDPFADERHAIARKAHAAGKVFNEETVQTFAPLYAPFHARAGSRRSP